jgi:hypothetical protein
MMEHQHDDVYYDNSNNFTPNTKSTTTTNPSNYLGDLILASPSVTSTTTTSLDETSQSNELDPYFPITAIQKLTFTSCIGATVDSSILAWPNESIDNELDELNKSIESHVQYLDRDVESLQEALYVSQQRNECLYQDII